uniref:Uncharacterized protein n=1 Tax=Solanum lycopersicum TaxID=4081 RepID=A0A3Q7GBG9_SOLLC
MGDAYGSHQSQLPQSIGLLKQLLPKYGLNKICVFYSLYSVRRANNLLKIFFHVTLKLNCNYHID